MLLNLQAKRIPIVLGSAGLLVLAVALYTPKATSANNDLAPLLPPSPPSRQAVPPQLDASEYGKLLSQAIKSQSDYKKLEAERQSSLLDRLTEFFDAWDNSTPDAYIQLNTERNLSYATWTSEQKLRQEWGAFGGAVWKRIDLKNSTLRRVPVDPETGLSTHPANRLSSGVSVLSRRPSFALPDTVSFQTAGSDNLFTLEFSAESAFDTNQNVFILLIWSDMHRDWFIASIHTVATAGQPMPNPPL